MSHEMQDIEIAVFMDSNRPYVMCIFHHISWVGTMNMQQDIIKKEDLITTKSQEMQDIEIAVFMGSNRQSIITSIDDGTPI